MKVLEGTAAPLDSGDGLALACNGVAKSGLYGQPNFPQTRRKDWFLDYNDREAWHCVHGN
ncbi:MAG: hypothetical protein U0176_07910 [Bacteroidia bacterium]